jgi:Spondin_N
LHNVEKRIMIAVVAVLGSIVLQLPIVQAQASTFVIASLSTSNIATARSVTYSCDFINQWTAQRHPSLYPTQDARWSPPLIVAHNRSVTLWANDTLATAGVEDLAEVRSSWLRPQKIRRLFS